MHNSSSSLHILKSVPNCGGHKWTGYTTMLSKISATHLGSSSHFRIFPCSYGNFAAIRCCAKNSPSNPPSSSSSENKFRFKLVGQPHSRWKLNEVDATAVQETLSHWLSKTQNIFNEVTSPLVKTVQERTPNPGSLLDMEDTEDMLIAEPTLDIKTLNGSLSVAAVVSIEQFSRMNGLTGLKMQKIFKALSPESIYCDARNLVEYCCFRFLSRDSSEIHPCLKEHAFRRLIFVTMLAWEEPYSRGNGPGTVSEKVSLKGRFVSEEAFIRIAPAISGLADWATAHNLFKALAGDDQGISYRTWSTYVIELLNKKKKFGCLLHGAQIQLTVS